MANGNGKTSPFNPDGKTGADSNSSANYENCHIGQNRLQKSGPNVDLHQASIPEGGKVLKLDPPSDRSGLNDAGPDGPRHKPFKLGGGDKSTTNADIDDAANRFIGDVTDMGSE